MDASEISSTLKSGNSWGILRGKSEPRLMSGVLLYSMRIDNFTKDNILMFFANSLGSFFNLLYQLAMLRLVTKDTFAGLNSLLSLLVIISVPSAAFTTMVTKHICSHNARKKNEHLKTVWQKLSIHSLLFSSIIFLTIILFRRHIADFLQLEQSLSIIILAGIFFFNGIAPALTGGLQGLEKFKWLAITAIAIGFLKLILSVVLVKNMANVLNGALCGLLLAIFIGIFLNIWPLRFLLKGKGREKIALKELYGYGLTVLPASLCFAVLTNVDMLLVKHFFLAEAQDYSVAQMIGKIIISISGMVYIVMFSRVSNLYAVKESSKVILRRSLFFTFILSFLAVAAYNLFPRFVFSILAGSVSEEVISLARLFSLSMLFFALSNVLFYYQLSIERYSFLKPLILTVVLEIAAISIFHKTTFTVASIMFVSSLTIFSLNLKSALRVAA